MSLPCIAQLTKLSLFYPSTHLTLRAPQKKAGGNYLNQGFK